MHKIFLQIFVHNVAAGMVQDGAGWCRMVVGGFTAGFGYNLGNLRGYNVPSA